MVFPGAITIPYTNHDKEPTHRLKLRFPKCTLSKVSDSKRKPNRNLFVLVNCQRKKTPSSRTAVPDWSGATLTYEINLACENSIIYYVIMHETKDSIEIEMFDDLGGVSKLFGVGVAKMLLPDTSNTAQTTSGSIALPHIEFVLRNPTGDDHSEFDLHDPGSGLVAKLSVSATLTRMATTDGAPTTDTARAKKLPATESNISNISHAPTAQNSSHGRYDRRQMTREDMEHAIAELEDKLDGEADE
ncbi:hypothetical protein SARC_03576 [Sphaeroforma arctica JP610]|uniref:C2 domain-containing protein n=1 Tax=Sphaeroforma arctica JP610 TaxID=667725 RepID=A0A0L0G5S7_9EUKA|nr:hypothetical protein SARC_03576 [Sphaeroforma arctica JP610]KNC84186.1 hypothetical protein SARC_03576 [Sphaeroforma arctica JP610]|eukprot:XP_014158088.1 hypothetical protein SARC_03576 [Sphaeroforma arctica JP610]